MKTSVDKESLTTQHTQTPWIVDDNPKNVGIREEGRGRLASLSEINLGQDLANAAFIVRACNAYEEMIDLLDSLEQDITDGTFDMKDNRNQYLNLIRKAIAKAESK